MNLCTLVLVGILSLTQGQGLTTHDRNKSKEKIWIDADFCADDALGTMIIQQSKKFEIVALSCVFGNTGSNVTCPNALRLLNILGLKIPVYEGASKPIEPPFQEVPTFDWFGEDGISGASKTYRTDGQKYEKLSAADALVKFFRENPGKITVAAFGPLTNLALAQKKDRSFLNNVKRLYIMGGNIYGRGNAYPDRPSGGEYNFAVDPEAARIVLTGNPKLTEVYPWETCQVAGLPWTVYNVAKNMPTRYGRILKDFSEEAANRFFSSGQDVYQICDLIAALALVDENVISGSEMFNATVETRGIYTNGMMVIQKVKNSKSNVLAIKSIHGTKQTEALMKFVSAR